MVEFEFVISNRRN